MRGQKPINVKTARGSRGWGRVTAREEEGEGTGGEGTQEGRTVARRAEKQLPVAKRSRNEYCQLQVELQREERRADYRHGHRRARGLSSRGFSPH